MAGESLHDAGMETAPLMGAAPEVILNGELQRTVSKTSTIQGSRFQAKRPQTIVMMTALLKFSVTFSGSMILLPIFRLLEDAFCHEYYQDTSPGMIDEQLCKVDEVQRRLAYLGGWVAMANAVVGTLSHDYKPILFHADRPRGLIVAMPYGILADRIGRRPTFLLAYSGLVISFVYGPCLIWFGRGTLNLYLLLISSLFLLIGGGIVVIMSVLYAIAADVSTDKDKAASFLYLTIGASAGGLVGPIIAGKLMESFGPWIPILVVYCTVPVVIMLALLLPETLQLETKESADHQKRPRLQAVQYHLSSEIQELGHSIALLRNPSILLIMMAFFVQNPLVVGYTGILAQYVSKHFGWKLAQTSYLLSPLSLLHLVVLALLPKFSDFLLSPRRSFRLTTFAKDLRLAQVSFAILMVSALLEGFSQEIVLFLIGLFVGTFAAGVSPFSRAIITAHVDAKHTSRLYALIGIVETVGSLFGGPVLAWCFDIGLRRRGLWRGLPWFYLAFLCSIGCVALSFVREPKKPLVEEEEEEEDLLDPEAPFN